MTKRKLAGPASVRNKEKKLKTKKSEKKDTEREEEISPAVVIKKEAEDGDSSAIIDKLSTLDEEVSEEETENKAPNGQTEIVRKKFLSKRIYLLIKFTV